MLDLIAASAGRRDLTLVGIGGRGAAGKTTLARLVPEAQVVATDAFWDGGRFDLERLRRDVLEPLLLRQGAQYEAWDWAAQQPAGRRSVEPLGIVVVEGVCALHRLLRAAYDVRVWVDAPREVRLARAVARDGAASRTEWEDRWLPSEDRYVERDDPVSCAQVVIDSA